MTLEGGGGEPEVEQEGEQGGEAEVQVEKEAGEEDGGGAEEEQELSVRKTD